MSRNIGEAYCCAPNCIVLEEEPRLIRENEAGVYFKEYEGMVVANAYCDCCYALYLAWVEDSPEWTRRYGRTPRHGEPCFDLSYREAFNDEPWVTDHPLFVVVTTREGGTRPVAWYEMDQWWADRKDDCSSYFAAYEEWKARRDAMRERLTAEHGSDLFNDGELYAAALVIDDIVNDRAALHCVYLMWRAAEVPKEIEVLFEEGANPCYLATPQKLQNGLGPSALWSNHYARKPVALPNGWTLTQYPLIQP